MRFDPETAAIRFGYGLSPRHAGPESVAAMLDTLRGKDRQAKAYPIDTFTSLRPMLRDKSRLQKAQRSETKEGKAAREEFRQLRRRHRRAEARYLLHTILRATTAPDPFRERLTRFWADHFTVKSRNGFIRRSVSTYVEEAIRPHVTGPFHRLLTAVVTHPMMLHYLDQNVSIGENAPAQRGRRGLNENLAREVLELHTLGVNGAYTQNDVRQLAELFTGLTFDSKNGFLFRANWAEPGAETVLGAQYGGENASLDAIEAFLKDVSVHSDTGRHLAWKLARHFVSDDPDPALVADIRDAYLGADGDLMAAYEALLTHPAAWIAEDRKIKQPYDFVTSALRALDVPPKKVADIKPRDAGTYLVGPMRVMGQNWDDPIGPDGWPEEAEAWITPQGLAGRLQWAMAVPRVARPDLPDPRSFVTTALGARASERLQFAAKSAATKWEGVGLILASAEFQRR